MTEWFDKQKLVEAVDQHLDSTLDRVDKGWDPVWLSQIEMGKSMLAMSSGTLVVSISFVQYLLANATTLSSVWLLPTAWILLTISIITTILRYSWMTRARTFRIMIEYSRSTIRKALRDINTSDDIGPVVDSILNAAIDTPWNFSKKGIQVHDALTQSAFWSFALALILLLIFTTRNLFH